MHDNHHSRKPFQFGLGSLFGLLTLVAVLLWLAIYQKALVGILLFMAGLATVLAMLFLVRVGIVWALGEIERKSGEK